MNVGDVGWSRKEHERVVVMEVDRDHGYVIVKYDRGTRMHFCDVCVHKVFDFGVQAPGGSCRRTRN